MMHLLMPLVHTLGQMPDKAVEPLTPMLSFDPPANTKGAWIVAGVLVAAILLMAFKQARRNHLDRAD